MRVIFILTQRHRVTEKIFILRYKKIQIKIGTLFLCDSVFNKNL